MPYIKISSAMEGSEEEIKERLGKFEPYSFLQLKSTVRIYRCNNHAFSLK